ncbi:hypothetical protein EVAR_96043_1 [Eumeta japonica]|uniref:Uncharacterized protein n=1 Tax=Eumeta variegata TaxID=151549 RepID=A0A4C1W6V3_EUMVA|nr:hypothetical protein EVAR_96043_1 [Eumeta japonica]
MCYTQSQFGVGSTSAPFGLDEVVLLQMDPVKKIQKALKISEIADYLQDLEDCSEEDLNDIEVAILPDEVDEVTDIEEGPDDDMGVIPVSDVAGQVEFSCTIDQTVYKRFQTKSLLFLDEKSEGSTCKPTPGSSKVLLEPVRFDNIGHYMTKRGKQRRWQGQGCKKNL